MFGKRKSKDEQQLNQNTENNEGMMELNEEELEQVSGAHGHGSHHHHDHHHDHHRNHHHGHHHHHGGGTIERV